MSHREGFAAETTPQLLPEGSTLLAIGTPTTLIAKENVWKCL